LAKIIEATLITEEKEVNALLVLAAGYKRSQIKN